MHIAAHSHTATQDEVDESKHDVPVVRTEAAFNALLDGGVAVVEFFQPW
jgi:hypothetical protein